MRQKFKALMLIFLLAMIFTIPAYADDTDAWLEDWDYYIYSSSATNPQIKITGYKGISTEAHIYGRVNIEGTSYRVNVSPYENNNNGVTTYVSPFNNTDNVDIEDLHFPSVDGDGVYICNGSSVDGLFWGMSNLKSIHFGDGTDFSNAYDGRWMFYGDTSLEEADFENLSFPRLVRASHMFDGASALKNVTITYAVGSGFEGLFNDCTSLETVNITTNTTHPSWMKCSEMFKHCESLTDVTMSGFNSGASSQPYTSMFHGCSSLSSFDLSQLDLSTTTDCSYMFCNCQSLTSLDFTQTTWNPNGVNLTGIIESCPVVTEITVDPNLIVSDSTTHIGYVPDATKLKIIGEVSESFYTNIIENLKMSNRYLEAIDVKASINLTGDETYDSWSYGLMLSSEAVVRVQENNGADSIYFSAAPNRLYIYEPGEYTLTLTQGNKAFDINTGYDKVDAVTETEDGFRCETNPLTKKINVIRNTDGSIVIEEV